MTRLTTPVCAQVYWNSSFNNVIKDENMVGEFIVMSIVGIYTRVSLALAYQAQAREKRTCSINNKQWRVFVNNINKLNEHDFNSDDFPIPHYIIISNKGGGVNFIDYWDFARSCLSHGIFHLRLVVALVLEPVSAPEDHRSVDWSVDVQSG